MSSTFEGKLRALRSLIQMMDVPDTRRDVSNRTNVMWLARNLGVQNGDHPLFQSTRDVLKWVIKNWEHQE